MGRLAIGAVLVAAGAGVVGLPSAAEAGAGTQSSFVVSTQFWGDPSPVVSASGAFASCTEVADLGGAGVQTGPNTVLFFGDKRLDCAEGSVWLSYEATMNLRAGRKTSGTWRITGSTLPGVQSGGGQLKGDNARCAVLPGSEGCIVDTFRGRVSG